MTERIDFSIDRVKSRRYTLLNNNTELFIIVYLVYVNTVSRGVKGTEDGHG